jgi:caffeoyl-CoA O-methyltransferase
MIPLIDQKLEAYASDHTSAEPELLKQLARETHETMTSPQMLTGALQATLLKMLIEMLGAERVLEVGMFTGYGTLMMASALPAGGEILTCETNPEAEVLARRYFSLSPHGHKIEIHMGPAIETIPQMIGHFDFIYIDADKKNYPAYYDLGLDRLRPGGVIAVDNVLWSGRVADPQDEDSRAIVELNDRVHRDDRVENVLLPIRDGLMLARKLPTQESSF